MWQNLFSKNSNIPLYFSSGNDWRIISYIKVCERKLPKDPVADFQCRVIRTRLSTRHPMNGELYKFTLIHLIIREFSFSPLTYKKLYKSKTLSSSGGCSWESASCFYKDDFGNSIHAHPTTLITVEKF